MLEFLRIRNLALIDDMELEFSAGLNVLTGETGAGKSFILKALNFITGEKLTADSVRPGAEKALVEALFTLPEGEVVIRRELNAQTGRSRLYVNDRLSSQETIRNLGSELVVHTSQHAQQKLLLPAFQGRILDEYMARPDLVEEKDGLIKKLGALTEKKNALLSRYKALNEKRDVLEFQSQEIEKVGPQAGEEERLEAVRCELKGQEILRETLEECLNLIHGDGSGKGDGIMAGCSQLERQLELLFRHLPEYKDDVERMAEFRVQIQDLAGRLRKQPVLLAEEQSVEEIDARLFELSQLKRKLHRSFEEIINLRDEIAENLSFLDACNLELRQMEKEEQSLVLCLKSSLEALAAARNEAAVQLSRQLEEALKGLGFSEEIKVSFSFTPYEVYAGCFEQRPRMLWTPNPGQPAQPLEKIASGGELSRFLLALIDLMSQDENATFVFDEVDSGVGGLTLNSVAQRISLLGRERQILLITHWPQLASKAMRHFFVYKEVTAGTTYTRCRLLENDEIKEELSRMAGGGEQGSALARELVLHGRGEPVVQKGEN